MSTARPPLLSVLWDVATFAGGWALLLKQAGILFPAPAQTSEMLIIGALLLIGVPGVTNLAAARFGIGPSPAPSASPDSPPPASSSSNTGGRA